MHKISRLSRESSEDRFDTIRGWLGYLRDTKRTLLAVAFKRFNGEDSFGPVILCLCMWESK